MGQINDHVIVTITRQSAKLLQAGFGVPLALCTFDTASPSAGVSFTGRYRIYKSTTEVKQDFTDDASVLTKIFSKEVIQIATKVFGQKVSPSALAVGRRVPGTTEYDVVFSGTVAIGDKFSVTLNGKVFLYTAAAATVADVSTGLATLINADLTQNVTADGTTTAGTLNLQADADTTFTVSAAVVLSTAGVVTLAIGGGNIAPEDASTALDAVIAENNAFYGVIHGYWGQIAIDNEVDILDLAAAIEGYGSANPKLYGACSDATDNATAVASPSGTDVANVLANFGYDRTFFVYSPDAVNYPHAGWMGAQFPKPPGSSNWKFKQVAGVLPTDLSTTNRNNLLAKKANFKETVAGVGIMSSEGTVCSGEYIDIIVGIDYLQARISENVFAVFLGAEKVPITNPGINSITKEIRAQLKIFSGPQLNFLDGDTIEISQPDVSQIPLVDRATRVLNDIAFTARLQGAVNKTYINGFLSV